MKKGQTQCFAKESLGHFLGLHFVLIKDCWKNILEEKLAVCKHDTSRDTFGGYFNIIH